jgi:hypothetical protein
MTTELDVLIQKTTDNRLVETVAGRTTVSALTRASYATAAEATVAAHELLLCAVRLGHRFEGGLVGARRSADGSGWYGELVEVLLVDREATPALPAAA